MQKTIYIAGKVTGLPEGEVREKFLAKEAELLATGANVINPVRFVHAAGIHNESWNYIMKQCLAEMMRADEVHVLPCWKMSRGALLEHDLALALEMKIVYPL